ALRTGDDARGARRSRADARLRSRDLGLGDASRRFLDHRSGSLSSLRSGDVGARLELGDTSLQLLVLLNRLAPFHDDLVEEVVDLVRVEALLETDVLELLRDDVFRRQC